MKRDIVQHVLNDGAYHPGSITVMLRQLGLAGAATDYAHYLYGIAQQYGITDPPDVPAEGWANAESRAESD